MPLQPGSRAKPLRALMTQLGRTHDPKTAMAEVPANSLTASRRDMPRATSRASRSNQLPFMLERPWDTERLPGFDTGALGLFHEPGTLPPELVGRGLIGGSE